MLVDYEVKDYDTSNKPEGIPPMNGTKQRAVEHHGDLAAFTTHAVQSDFRDANIVLGLGILS